MSNTNWSIFPLPDLQMCTTMPGVYFYLITPKAKCEQLLLGPELPAAPTDCDAVLVPADEFGGASHSELKKAF